MKAKYCIRLTSLIIIISLVAIASCSAYEDHLDITDSPIEKTQPVEILHISGNKSPSLSIEIIAEYVAKNDSCNRVISLIEGAKQARGQSIRIPLQQSSNSYEATVILDKYEEGSCKWAPFEVSLFIKKDGVPAIMPVTVWVSTPGKGNTLLSQDVQGVNELPPFDVLCQDQLINSKNSLNCKIPRENHVITNESKELKINIFERAWLKVPVHN